MKTVVVPKADLIAKMKQNREEHREVFLAAQQAYRKKVIDLLDQRLEDAKAGRAFDIVVRLPEPVDYTSAYDTAIDMLEWDVNNTVVLDRADFERYVENKWEWAQHFAANTVAYVDGSL